MSSASETVNEKWEPIGNVKFLQNNGYSFDGCDTVRLYDYLIYYEQQALKHNFDENKRIRWFVYHMCYGSHVYYQLKDDQKRSWAEFKQNLLEAYKQHEQVRMSWSVPRYIRHERNVKPIISQDSGESNFNSKRPNESSTEVVFHDRFQNQVNRRSKDRRRCYNCGSASHILRDCRVSPASVRRTNNHRANVESQ